MKLPRFANRGLIEARSGFVVQPQLIVNFPDSRIGASLKPARARYSGSGPSPNFPDSRIGASLKPCARPGPPAW